MYKKGTIEVKNSEGKTETVHYYCKHFDEPSQYGIENRRISKLTLKQNGKIVYNFDRGLDIEPQTAEAESTLAILVHEYN